MSRKQVQVGQVYQVASASSGRTWRVKSTVTLFGIPHARIVNTEDEGEMKTLSCLVLADSSFYRLVESPPTASHAA